MHFQIVDFTNNNTEVGYCDDFNRYIISYICLVFGTSWLCACVNYLLLLFFGFFR